MKTAKLQQIGFGLIMSYAMAFGMEVYNVAICFPMGNLPKKFKRNSQILFVKWSPMWYDDAVPLFGEVLWCCLTISAHFMFRMQGAPEPFN